MPVGTGAITLQEVCNEMTGVQTSLQDCVDDYIAAGMNDTYWTSKPSDPVSLAEFRGYNGTPTITYYRLTPCLGGTSAYSDAGGVPVSNRQYVLPASPNVYYTWDGTSVTQTSPPAGYNGSIQQTVVTGCP